VCEVACVCVCVSMCVCVLFYTICLCPALCMDRVTPNTPFLSNFSQLVAWRMAVPGSKRAGQAGRCSATGCGARGE